MDQTEVESGAEDGGVSQTPEMVERVARALHASFNANGYCDYTYPWDHPLASQEMFRKLAFDAISAMLKPTGQMKYRGRVYHSMEGIEIAEACWRSMIAEALRRTPPTT